MDLGQIIKEIRIERGLTQEQLAKKMGYSSRQAICKVERGKENITINRIEKFAEALNVSLSYILDYKGGK